MTTLSRTPPKAQKSKTVFQKYYRNKFHPLPML